MISSPSLPLEQPLVSYRFVAVFLTMKPPVDLRFQKISGLSNTIKSELLQEGGENTIAHHLPSTAQPNNVILESGRIIGLSGILKSLLINETFSQFRFNPTNILITALNHLYIPRSAWILGDAYPVKWSSSDLDANANSIIIDSLELACASLKSITV